MYQCGSGLVLLERMYPPVSVMGRKGDEVDPTLGRSEVKNKDMPHPALCFLLRAVFFVCLFVCLFVFSYYFFSSLPQKLQELILLKASKY